MLTETELPKRFNFALTAFLLLSPPLAITLGALYFHYFGMSWLEASMFLVFYIISGLGITGGYHRYWSHKSYECSRPLQYLLLWMGTTSLQMSVFAWASNHRYHHRHVDKGPDPYNIKKGFFYAHLGWIFYDDAVQRSYSNINDLKKDWLLAFQHKYYWPLAIFFCFGVPTLVGLAFGNPLAGLIWGGFIRYTFISHCVFLINSAAHVIGRQPYSKLNSAKDSHWISVLSFGEGYHNFHHTFPSDFRNGVRWFHFDPGKWMILAFSSIGMAYNLKKTPSNAIIKAVNAQSEKEKLEVFLASTDAVPQ